MAEVSISEPDADGVRTMHLKFDYNESEPLPVLPLRASDIQNVMMRLLIDAESYADIYWTEHLGESIGEMVAAGDVRVKPIIDARECFKRWIGE